MARIRTIKPEAFKSETLSEVSVYAERTFFGMLTQVDDQGRHKDQPAVLHGALWPLRAAEHSVEDLKHDLDELERIGMLCRYEVAGRNYLHLPTFNEHQVINRPSKPKLPPCPVHDADLVKEEPGASVTHLPFGEVR